MTSPTASSRDFRSSAECSGQAVREFLARLGGRGAGEFGAGAVDQLVETADELVLRSREARDSHLALLRELTGPDAVPPPPGAASLVLAFREPAVWKFLRPGFREGLLREGGPTRLEASADGSRTMLPILVAARDEERTLPRTLQLMLPSIQEFRRVCPGAEVVILVCDNGSRDGTRGVALECRDALGREGIPLHLLSEPRPGKEQATRCLLEFVIRSRWNPPCMVFADAEVDWTPETLTALWQYLERHPGIAMVGGNIIPRDGTLSPGNVWGVLDAIPYLSYGQEQDHGRGRHLRFAIGMTYMARAPEIFRIHAEVPDVMANEDVAVNLLFGAHRVAIADRAVLRYRACGSWRELVATRYRHVRGNLQLVEWMAAREAVRLLGERWPRLSEETSAGVWDRVLRDLHREGRRNATRLVREVIDMNTLSIARGLALERHRAPVQDPDGRVVLKTGWTPGHSPTHTIAIALFMLPVYTLFKLLAAWDLRRHPDRTGWTPYRPQ